MMFCSASLSVANFSELSAKYIEISKEMGLLGGVWEKFNMWMVKPRVNAK